MARRLKIDRIIKLVLFILVAYIVLFKYNNMVDYLKNPNPLFSQDNELQGDYVKNNNQDLGSIEQIARSYVLNSGTYDFDGRNLTLVSENELDCDNCWLFTYQFKSSYLGYGSNRTQEEQSQELIIGHRIDVGINGTEIMFAIIDDEWDELSQISLLK